MVLIFDFTLKKQLLPPVICDLSPFLFFKRLVNLKKETGTSIIRLRFKFVDELFDYSYPSNQFLFFHIMPKVGLV